MICDGKCDRCNGYIEDGQPMVPPVAEHADHSPYSMVRHENLEHCIEAQTRQISEMLSSIESLQEKTSNG